MRYKVLASIAVVAILSACQKDGDDSMTVGDKRIIGAWEWTKTEDFEPENYHERFITPDIANKTQSIEFSNDGNYAQKENMQTTKNGRFSIFGDNALILISDQDTLDFNYEISSSNLILEDLKDSGVVITYVKSKTGN